MLSLSRNHFDLIFVSLTRQYLYLLSTMQDKILDALFDIFRLTVNKNSDPFHMSTNTPHEGDELGNVIYCHFSLSYLIILSCILTATIIIITIIFIGSLSDASLDLPSRTRSDRHNLINNYLSALLMGFIHCGLMEVSTTLSMNSKHNRFPFLD